MEIYYLEGQEQRGPFDRKDFVQLIHSGVIQGQTLVYFAALGSWKPYTEAYYDIFPESRPAFPIAQPTTAKGTVDTVEPTGVKDMENTEHDSGGFMAHAFAFYSLYGLWIKIAAVFLVLALIGNYVANNREKWLDDAVTMKDKEFDAGDARSAIKKAAKEWKKTAKLIRKGDTEAAWLSYDEGYQHIRFAYQFHRAQVIKDNKKVSDLVAEAIQPVNEEIDKQFNELLDRFESGQAYGSEVETFRYQYNHYVLNNIYRIYKQRMGKIDTERAKLAPKTFRVQLHLEFPGDTDEETPEYRRVRKAVEAAVRSKFQAPNGYRVAFGEAAGPKEEAATFFTCNVRVGFEGVPYYFDLGKEEHESYMVAEYRNYKPDIYVTNLVTVSLFDYSDKTRMQQNGVTTNWDKLAVYQVKSPMERRITVPKNAKKPERLMIMSRHIEKANEDMIQKFEIEFILPKFEAKMTR